jgi:hypothetical protein
MNQTVHSEKKLMPAPAKKPLRSQSIAAEEVAENLSGRTNDPVRTMRRNSKFYKHFSAYPHACIQ